jgi:biopolymer transport protein ExbD
MDEKEFDYMNVIPFVDIMLVLLTIVLTTSTFVATGVIPVDLPEASESSTEMLKSQIIEIDRRGQIFLNADQVTIDALKQSIRLLDKTTAILVRADQRIALQIFVDVLDTVKVLGFTKIRLQTEYKP